MRKSAQKVVMSLVVLYLFVLLFQLIAIHVIVNRIAEVTGRATSGTVSLVITERPPSSIPAPENENAALNPDHQSVDITWSPVSGVSSYVIYYSENLTAIRNINTSDIPAYMNQVTVNDTNWTDSNVGSEVVRFYRVASNLSGIINVSTTILGKQKYFLKASSDASKRNNLFALIYNYNYNFSKYLNSFCAEYPVICDPILGIPTIQAIDRSNPEAQPYVTHPYGFSSGAGYKMKSGEGYLMLVNQSYNKTETGVLPNLIFVNLSASSDTSKRNNLFGDNYIEGENFSVYLGYICTQEPQICDPILGIPTIQAIDRSNPEAQPYVTHPYGFSSGAGYKMKSGEGYRLLVNESIILIFNNTVIR